MAINDYRERQIFVLPGLARLLLGPGMIDEQDSLLPIAAMRFLAPGGGFDGESVAFQRISQGFSGASVLKCTTRGAAFALKRWPQGTAAQRMDDVHRVQRFAAHSLSIVPPLIPWRGDETRLTLGTTHFDCSRWLPGSVFEGPTGNVASVVFQGAAAIARFHRATAGLGTEKAIAPAVFQRRKRLAELKERLPLALARCDNLTGSLRLAAVHLAQNWPKWHDVSEAKLRPWSDRTVTIQWVLRDVHREHILFDDGLVTGMVDFDAVKRDTMATDLARWVGSFANFSANRETLWKEAVLGYQTGNTISPCEQDLAGAIEEASEYIHLANWVVWIALERREFPGGIDAVEGRVTRLLRSTHVKF